MRSRRDRVDAGLTDEGANDRPHVRPADGGNMVARVRAFDGSRTPLGPMDGWPQSLRTAVGICLNSRFPMFL